MKGSEEAHWLLILSLKVTQDFLRDMSQKSSLGPNLAEGRLGKAEEQRNIW